MATISNFSNIGPMVWADITTRLRFMCGGITNELIVLQTIRDGVVLLEQQYRAVNFVNEIDLKPIIRSLTNPIRPLIGSGSSPASTPQDGKGVTLVTFKFRLSTSSTWDVATYYLLAGGWRNMISTAEPAPNMYTGPNPPLSFYPLIRRLLSYAPTGRYIDAAEFGWITYCQDLDAIPYQKVSYYVKYLDGTWGVFTKAFPFTPPIYSTWNIPCGIRQVGLDPTGKGVDEITIQVAGGDDGDIVLLEYRLKVDERPLYTWLDIHYRNSLGGWDFFRFRGRIVFSSAAERKEYSANASAKGLNNYYASNMRLKWSAATGYISQQHMAALNDLLISRDICILLDSQWIPVKCVSKDLTWSDSKDGLFNEVFEFESAELFDAAPKQMVEFFNKYPEWR